MTDYQQVAPPQEPRSHGRSRGGAVLRSVSLGVTVPAAAAAGQGGARYCRGRCRGVRRTEKQLLQDVSLRLAPGEMTALLGPSAAGKTTLLNVLAQRQHEGKVTGTVSLSAEDGALAAPTRMLCCLVPQENCLLPGITVYQTLWYAAAMRLPLLSGGEREARVRGILNAHGLADCSDAIVDSAGLSGGQRKLVSVALELLVDPPVLLLDEPITGLDSNAADTVLLQLRRLATGAGSGGRVSGGNTKRMGDADAEQPRGVLCSVHQPSGYVLSHFDRILLLAPGGRLAFDGRIEELEPFISRLELPVLLRARALETTCEHAIRIVMQGRLTAVVDTMVAARVEQQQSEITAAASLDNDDSSSGLLPEVLEDSIDATLCQCNDPQQQQLNDLLADDSACRPSWYVLFWFGLCRFAVQRVQGGFVSGLLVRCVIGLLMGATWYDQSQPENEAILTIQGALFVLALYALLDTTIQTATLLPQCYAVISREWCNGYYPISAILAALTVTHMLLHVLHIVVIALPVFMLAGLRGSLLWCLAPLVLLGWVGVAVGLASGSGTHTFQEAQQRIIPVLLPAILFSGAHTCTLISKQMSHVETVADGLG